MNIFKLRYKNKQEGINDLKSKGVLVEVESINNDTELVYGQGVHSIVEIGLIVDKEGTFDDEGNVLTDPIYFNGYHYDVMSEKSFIFENEIQVKSPKHTFAGYE
jgi:hypothetical protein